MKTIFTIILLPLLLLSCAKKQSYMCYCTTTKASLWGDPTITNKSYNIYNKEKRAQKECDEHEESGIWTKTECVIK